MSTTLQIEDGVADVVLGRPETGNAIDLDAARALHAAVRECAERPEVRVVVLRAQGRAFCVGGDLGFMAAAGDRAGAVLRELADELHRGVLALAELPVPVVVAVQGPAAGAGLSLVCCGDLVLASASASFTVAYTAVGLSPDGGSSWHLPRIVGWRRAAELMLTNRRLGADEAAAWGLVDEVVADEALPGAARALARRLAAGSAPAQAAVRTLLAASATNGLAEQLELEAETIAELAGAPDGREGVAAFLAKRPPAFAARRPGSGAGAGA